VRKDNKTDDRGCIHAPAARSGFRVWMQSRYYSATPAGDAMKPRLPDT